MPKSGSRAGLLKKCYSSRAYKGYFFCRRQLVKRLGGKIRIGRGRGPRNFREAGGSTSRRIKSGHGEITMFNKSISKYFTKYCISSWVYSSGEDLVTLCDQVSGISELSEEKVKISIIIWPSFNFERIPFVRNLIAMIIANRLTAM